ncbi:MAG TPA: acetyl-CoA carboxylase carboxyltransferase subunit alpha [Euzebya sp.]|nr:acetyl-CoA carboxylase carboxyltransferase subunit alpha [Euzebya sp.]
MATPTAEWLKCPSCEEFLYERRLQRNLRVCTNCGYHFRISVDERLAQLLDKGSFDLLSKGIESVDVLSFVDAKPYPQRLQESRAKTGRDDAAMYGMGTMEGHPVVVAIMDFSFMGGSMGAAVGEVITRAAEHALATRTPLLIITASGGARMQEGSISLMQMAKTAGALARLDDAGILCICLLTDPTYGGVTASYAMLGDVLVSEPAALVGFAGPRVIQQTIRQELPEGFQTAEFLMQHGMLDLVATRENLRRELVKLISHTTAEAPTVLEEDEGAPPVTDPASLVQRPAWETVQLARNQERPTTLEYAGYLLDDYSELLGDRLFGQNSSIVGGPGRLDGLPVMLIGHQKGHTTADLVARNFGMPDPEGYRKALRLMQLAAKLGMPVITLVDTPGAFPGLEAEERGQAIAIARNILEMSRLPVPIIVVVTGEGGSGGALALGVGDRVLMLQNAYYSVISPEGCSAILWNNAADAPKAAEALRLDAPSLLTLKVMDGVVPEPEGGAHTDPATSAVNLKRAIATNLNQLLGLPVEQLLQARYDRFRMFGTDQQPTIGGMRA